MFDVIGTFGQTAQIHQTPDQNGLSAFFWEGVEGRIFCVQHSPRAETRTRGSIILIPPFAEEMNKSRRMIALQARCFADLGFRTIIPDLFGTGDSEGEFSEASWDVWIQDIEKLIRWASQGVNAQCTLWAVRFGALLAIPILETAADKVERIIFWNPMRDGAQFSRELARLAKAGTLVGTQKEETVAKVTRESATVTEQWEIGGYEISKAFIDAAEDVRLCDLDARKARVLWADVVRSRSLPPSRAIGEVIASLEARSLSLSHVRVQGDLFWSTSEIAVVSELLGATREWMR